jgi:hypothetical protein
LSRLKSGEQPAYAKASAGETGEAENLYKRVGKKRKSFKNLIMKKYLLGIITLLIALVFAFAFTPVKKHTTTKTFVRSSQADPHVRASWTEDSSPSCSSSGYLCAITVVDEGDVDGNNKPIVDENFGDHQDVYQIIENFTTSAFATQRSTD